MMTTETIKLLVEWQEDPNSEYYIKPEEFELEKIKGFSEPIKKRDGILLANDIVNVSERKIWKLEKMTHLLSAIPNLVRLL